MPPSQGHVSTCQPHATRDLQHSLEDQEYRGTRRDYDCASLQELFVLVQGLLLHRCQTPRYQGAIIHEQYSVHSLLESLRRQIAYSTSKYRISLCLSAIPSHSYKYLTKSNFIFPCSAPTNGQERAMKKHMFKYLLSSSS